MYRVEYLVTVEETTEFCKNVAGLHHLLRTIDGLKVSSTEITTPELKIEYEVEAGSILNDRHRFFHIRLTHPETDKLDKFEALLRSIRGVLQRIGSKPPQVLWDGISTHYSSLAYPRINEIENLLRKLITKFMLTNVGLGWTSDYVPKEVDESIRTKLPTNNSDYLYQTDFIQLSTFLFKEYSTLSAQVLLDTVKKATDISQLKLEDLQQAIPRSNWDRYFSKVVNCDSEYLRVRWTKLYERRNQIAHNRALSRVDFAEIESLCDDLSKKFQEAIQKLDAVTIDETAKEEVSANAAVNTNRDYKEFLQAWDKLHGVLFFLTMATNSGPEDEKNGLRIMNNIRALLNVLRSRNVINPEQREKVNELFKLRNVMVHQPDAIVLEPVVAVRLEELTELTLELDRIEF